MNLGISRPHLAMTVWLIILLAISIRVALRPNSGTVLPVFTDAAGFWLDRQDMYLAEHSPYRYSPVVALTFIPFQLMPASVSGVLWRLLNAAVYLGALAGWFRSNSNRPPSPMEQAILFLLVIPLSIGSLNNGQSNPLVLGMLLIALQTLAKQEWNLASGCLAIACLFKIYPIALALLLILLYPKQLSWRFSIALALGLLLPFAFAPLDYVSRQYSLWVHDLSTDDRTLCNPDYWYRDIRLLIHEFHYTVGPLAYVVLEITVGAVMAVFVVYWQWKQCNPQALLRAVFTLSCCWMTVFGPASESCSYIYLAPSLAWHLFDAWRRPGIDLARLGMLLSLGLFLSTSVAAWFPGGRVLVHAHGLHPLAGLLFLISWLLWEIQMRSRSEEDGEFSLAAVK